MYVIVLMLILGFDEFVHVISNPILLLFIVMLGIGVYVIHILNLSGPVKTVIETLLNTSLAGFQKWLSDQLSQHNIPANNNNNTTPTISDNNNNNSNSKTKSGNKKTD